MNQTGRIIQKIALLLIVIVLSIFLLDVLLKKPIKKEDAILVEGQFERIERFRPKNKVSVSYNIFLQQSQDFYKVLPEWINCFDYDSFGNEIKAGQSLQVYIKKDNGFARFADLPIVVSVIANGKDYINQDCINNEIETSKIQIPLILTGGLLVIGALRYMERRKKKRY